MATSIHLSAAIPSACTCWQLRLLHRKSSHVTSCLALRPSLHAVPACNKQAGSFGCWKVFFCLCVAFNSSIVFTGVWLHSCYSCRYVSVIPTNKLRFATRASASGIPHETMLCINWYHHPVMHTTAREGELGARTLLKSSTQGRHVLARPLSR